MAVYKDEKSGTWFVSFHWTGKNCRKVKRGKTRRKAVEWE